MSVKIEHKVSHREWDEASLTPEQFIKFDELYHSEDDNSLHDRYSLCPTFVFDNGSVYADESWDIDSKGRVSTSSFQCGVMSFSEKEGQYTESVHYSKKELGQLVSVDFTVEDDMSKVFSLLK